ncbi:MAG: hypothetical protein ABSB11_01855 [Sedimentisphaerales bacterium]|jgi:hypothetical protein
MKRLLVILLALGLSVPAMAHSGGVLVYNLKQSGVEFEYNSDANTWAQSPKSNHSHYLVIEMDSNSPGSINLWSVETWKGVTTNYYTAEGPADINFTETSTASKTIWIISDIFSSGGSPVHIMVSGQAKPTKIGTGTYTVAAAMSGYVIFGDIIPDGDVGAGTLSMTLNPKATIALTALVLNGDVDSAINDYLTGLGYVPGSD